MTNSSEKPEPDVGRGMLGVSMADDGTVQLEHQDTGATFEFQRDDLEEVIDTLDEFRKFLRGNDAN